MTPVRINARLGDLADIRVDSPDADFWVTRRGMASKVGHPVRSYSPEHYGVKVVRTDVLDPNYLYYLIQHIANEGYFAQRATGSTALVNIRVRDLATLPMQIEVPAGGQGSGSAGPRDPYPLALVGVVALSVAALVAFKLLNGK
jgi:hypothetical protein